MKLIRVPCLCAVKHQLALQPVLEIGLLVVLQSQARILLQSFNANLPYTETATECKIQNIRKFVQIHLGVLWCFLCVGISRT